MPLNPDIAWMDDAACTGAEVGIFVPNVETEHRLGLARTWCLQCPVRVECLAWAMEHHVEGYWGGTSTYQRAQLRRVRTRAKCPLCLATALVYADPHEMCVACGASWVRDVRLEPLAASPPPGAA